MIDCIPKMNGATIARFNVTKFWGVMLDSQMTWPTHIHIVHPKVSKGIGMLCRSRTILKLPTLVILYIMFIHPH